MNVAKGEGRSILESLGTSKSLVHLPPEIPGMRASGLDTWPLRAGYGLYAPKQDNGLFDCLGSRVAATASRQTEYPCTAHWAACSRYSYAEFNRPSPSPQ
jgi:hypothetical protein